MCATLLNLQFELQLVGSGEFCSGVDFVEFGGGCGVLNYELRIGMFAMWRSG